MNPVLEIQEPDHGQFTDYKGGWKACHLYHVGFVADDPIDPNNLTCASGAFAFIDPTEVIHGIHLIPSFTYGKTSELLEPSIAHPQKNNNEEWQNFYVRMYHLSFILSLPS